MNRRLELEELQAEKAAIFAFLREAESLDDPVGIMQYMQRQAELDARIQQLKEPDSHQASVVLVLGGKPVLGSRGVAADFAGGTLKHFQDIISRRIASVQRGNPDEKGDASSRASATLMVTGVTHGSFGFLLDELDEQAALLDTELKAVVGQVFDLIESAAAGDEVGFELQTEGLDSRTLGALRGFFIDLDKNGATVSLKDEERDLVLDEAAVHRARFRTEATHVEEGEDDFEGVLIGLLPEHRRFELQPVEGETIYGTVSPKAAEQYLQMLRGGVPVIGETCVARVGIREVIKLRGEKKTSYTLLEFEQPSN